MRWIATIGLLLVLVTAVGVRGETAPAASSLAPTSATDWPGFLGPHRNGKSDERGLPKVWPPKGPPVVWQAAVGTGYSAPAIAIGRLFTSPASRTTSG